MIRTRRDERLHVWFAVVSAVLLAVLGLVLALQLRGKVDARARASMEEYGRTIAVSLVAPLLDDDELTSGRGLPAERLREVDVALERGFRDLPMDRVKVFGSDGTIVYSDEVGNVGVTRELEGALAGALDGQLVSELETADDEAHRFEADLGDQLEVFVPLADTGGDVLGVVEVYLPYGPTAALADRDTRRLVGVLAAGLAVLWLSLWHLVRSTALRLRQQNERTRWLANNDELTQLANRPRFEQVANDTLEQDGRASLLMVDLNRFKEVNDTFGHQVGDRLLHQVGVRLQDRMRDGDLVARLGGDEFAVLLPESDPDRARAVAARLAQDLAEPFVIDDLGLEIAASVGIAIAPLDGSTYDDLVRCADTAMYAAKRDAVAVKAYEPSLDQSSTTRLVLFGDLRRAIDDDELSVELQPKVDVRTRRVTGVEALARWEHPTHGKVFPDVFIPLAEQTGLIAGVTRCVARKALAALAVLHREQPDLRLAVNLSARDLLDHELAATLAEACDQAGVARSSVELEITETSAMRDPQRSLEVLHELRDAGFDLAIDDYGTGHSSLAYIRSLPVTTLKIDRAFMVDVATNRSSQAIVRSTVELGRSLGLRVVAEGVEDGDGFEVLRAVGCHDAQGYWLARPTPVEDAAAVIAALDARLGGLDTTLRAA